MVMALIGLSAAACTSTSTPTNLGATATSVTGTLGSTTAPAISPSPTTTASSQATIPVPTSALGDPPPQARAAQTEIEHNSFGPVCVVTVQPGSSENAPKTPAALSGHPFAVDAVRIPGLNDPLCRSGVVTASAALAGELGVDVNATQSVPQGRSINCPDDDGHGIDLVFRYAEPSEATVVSVDFSGCQLINGLTTARWSSEAVTADLKRFVPSTWF